MARQNQRTTPGCFADGGLGESGPVPRLKAFHFAKNGFMVTALHATRRQYFTRKSNQTLNQYWLKLTTSMFER